MDRMKFTGHERDLASMTGGNPAADDLDYMHARTPADKASIARKEAELKRATDKLRRPEEHSRIGQR